MGSVSEAEIVRVEPDELGSTRLRVGETVEAILRQGEVHRFSLPDEGERIVRATVDQRGIDLVFRLVESHAQAGVQIDSRNETQGLEALEGIAPDVGSTYLEVESLVPDARSGRYRVSLDELVPVTAANRAVVATRAKALKEFESCSELFVSGIEVGVLEAKGHCKASLELAQQLDDEHLSGWANMIMGRILRRLGRKEPVRGYLDQALENWSGDRYAAERALVLSEKAEIARGAGDLDAASEAFTELIAFWRSREDPLLEATAVNNLGRTLRDGNEFAAAIEMFERAKVLLEEAGDPAAAAGPLYNWGTTEFYRGNYPSAMALYAETRRRLKGHEKENADAFIDLLIGEGTILQRTGETGRMLEKFESAWPLIEEYASPGRKATLLKNQASAFHTLGDYEAAQDSYQQALALARQDGNRWLEAFTLANFADLRMVQGLEDDATASYEEALSIGRELGDKTILMLALTGRGKLLAWRGDPVPAIRDLEEALRMARDSGAVLRQADVQIHLGKAHMELSQSAKGRGILEESIAINAGRDPFLEASARFELGLLERSEGDLEAALGQMEVVRKIDADLRNGANLSETRDLTLASRRDHLEALIELLLQLNEVSPNQGYAREAFDVSEQARARGLTELLTESRVQVRHSLSAEMLAQERRVTSEIAGTQAQLARVEAPAERAAGELARLNLRLASLRDKRRRLEARIRRESPRYAQITYPEPLSLAQTQELLSPGTVLLEYVMGESGCQLFVVSRDQFHAASLLVSSQAVREMVDNLRAGLAGTGRFQTRKYRAAARQLYEELIAPVAEILQSYGRLLIVPDRELFYVPFEVLLTADSDPGRDAPGMLPYLIKQFEIAYVPSASVLSELERLPTAKNDRLVIFADPDYSESLPRLTASKQEALEISSLFPRADVTVFLGEMASESNLKQSAELSSARWVHLAMHGTIEESETADTRLELSNTANDGAEDGALHLREIFELDLSAEMVVLSACETALGRQVTGEGLIGLSRGFFYAGARSVVVSQWRVDDVQTASFMVRFYRSLTGTRDEVSNPIAALRQAKLEALETMGVHGHPHYWAPFVLVGNPLPGGL